MNIIENSVYNLKQIYYGSESLKLGDFEFRKAYNVGNSKTNGIIVQYVNRTTNCNYNGIHLNTTSKISEFTDNYVQHSNTSYFEYFIVKNGKSIDCDSFANGAISKYNFFGNPILNDGSNNKGSITYKAESFFISDKNTIYNEIIELPWINDSKNLPSNGLHYLSDKYKKKIENYKKKRDSNIAEHILSVKWNGSNENSVLESDFYNKK